MTQTPDKTDKMTLAEFEQRLQSTEFFEAETGQVSDDPRLQVFLTENPEAAALVRDLKDIAAAVAQLLKPEADVEPSDTVWKNIQSELGSALDPGIGNASLKLAK